MKITALKRRLVAALMIGSLMLPSALWAQSAVDQSPSALAMAGDLVVARPIGIVVTAVGAAAWVVSLPFTLLAGHSLEAGNTLVVGPAKNTFVRCLGCTEAGYTYRDRDTVRKGKDDPVELD